MGTWSNNDGLYIKMGVDEVNPAAKSGEYVAFGDKRIYEFDIDLTTLATATDSIVADYTMLPKNARIEEVEVEVVTAAVGATATLDVGLIGTDRTTVDSATGLVAAAAVATLAAAGNRLTLITGATAAGNRIGTTLAGTRLVTAGANTAVFTQGLVKVRVKVFFL